jgi:hypothetical protein
MPANERVRANDRQHLAPGDEPRKQHERDTRGVVRAFRSDPPLNVLGELLAQEEVLGGEFGAGAKGQSQQVQQVCEKGKHGSDHVTRSYGLHVNPPAPGNVRPTRLFAEYKGERRSKHVRR